MLAHMCMFFWCELLGSMVVHLLSSTTVSGCISEATGQKFSETSLGCYLHKALAMLIIAYFCRMFSCF